MSCALVIDWRCETRMGAYSLRLSPSPNQMPYPIQIPAPSPAHLSTDPQMQRSNSGLLLFNSLEGVSKHVGPLVFLGHSYCFWKALLPPVVVEWETFGKPKCTSPDMSIGVVLPTQ